MSLFLIRLPRDIRLRLLELPEAWSDFIERNPDGASCIGPSSALKTSQERYQKVVERLQDEGATTIYLVSRPEEAVLEEAERSSKELKQMGLSNQLLLVNGYFEPFDESDKLAQVMKKQADESLEHMPESLKEMEQHVFSLRPYNLLGIDKLRKVFEPLDKNSIKSESYDLDRDDYESSLPDLTQLVNDITKDKDHGLVLTMGKGGVGKTTMAVAIAMKLARRGHPVHLTTTDPAAHLMQFLGDSVERPEQLTVDLIDPKAEKQAYIEKVMKCKGADMDEEERKLLREDLESPCTEEVAVFQAFSKEIHKAKSQFVVMDTAPTGHTLLLLDTTGSYHREVMRNSEVSAGRLKTPYMYLKDPEFAKLLLVTLPETTPSTEAAQLQEDLRRSEIEPYGWIANQSLSAAEISDPLLKQRAAEVKKIEEEHASRLYSVPWLEQDTLIKKVG